LARGFDSKSVSDQQEEMLRSRERTTAAPPVSARRRTLELARRDLVHRLELAPEVHKDRMRAALADLDSQIEKA
jgi:hypothetical protein